MSEYCVLILAAGEGKRMKSDLPKVLHPVGGKPMVAHVVDAARRHHPRKIIVVVSPLRLAVKDMLVSDVAIAVQKQPRGTADAVRSAWEAIPKQSDHVLVLYGDTPLITAATVGELRDRHKNSGAACTVLTTVVEDATGYGRILRSEAGEVVGIVEHKDATTAQRSIREINTGMYCFKTDVLKDALEHVKPSGQTGEYYLTDVLSWMVRQGHPVNGVAAPVDEVLGVNSPEELMEAEDIFRRRVLARHIAAGVKVMDMATTFIDDSVVIGPQTVIFPFCYIEKNAVIGCGCSVGPFCHLRENAVLKDGASVGNFTEIKNSTLGEGTYMRHMSYVGDTQVGRKVNIGAGTVVANFDGKAKHRTIIKDGAFVGCDSVLVAPVVIGKGAVVGAGSVVTRHHDVADHSVVAGVPARPLAVKKKLSDPGESKKGVRKQRSVR